MENDRIEKVLSFLKENNLEHTHYTHPEAPTIEIARQYWQKDGSKHCKNLFFRNHKGNRHYLVVLDCDRDLDIHDLEKRLHQGKLSFASPQRMEKYLGLTPGSVSPFGLINDTENHVHLFLDANLRKESSLSFHPNDNTASLIISSQDMLKFIDLMDNTVEYLQLY